MMINKRICSNIGRYSRLQAPIVRAHRGESIKAETVQREEKTDTESAPSTARMLRRGSSRGVSAAFRIGWPAGRPAGRSVGRSGSLTRTVADPSVDYSGDLTWTWKQVLGIRFSILHTTLINAARLLHRIGTYAVYGELARWTLARGRMRYLVIPSGIMCVVCSTGDGHSSAGQTVEMYLELISSTSFQM